MESMRKILQDITDEDTACQIINYIDTIPSAEDVEEYLQDFLDMTNKNHLKALKEIMKTKTRKEPLSDMIAYRKGSTNPNETVHFNNGDKFEATPVSKSASNSQRGSSEKKKKFVPLFSQTGETTAVILPGRHACDCLATKHDLVNNCLSCGRIVCSQEGSGPCFFCKELVCTPDEAARLARDSNKAGKLRSHLMSKEWDPSAVDTGKAKAMAHKERLLEFDRTSARRTRVIDDEMDYYAADNNTWLSSEERLKLQAKEDKLREIRFASRLSQPVKITLDLAGRKVIEEDTRGDASHALYSHDQDPDEEDRMSCSTRPFVSSGDGSSLIDPNITIQAPTFVVGKSSNNAQQKKKLSSSQQEGRVVKDETARRALRLQDSELQEMHDSGVCLSMHQPYASLLIGGVKLDEGRNWYSPHRGRLWIASTAHKVTDEEVSGLADFYKSRGIKGDQFPSEFPSGCLLGCVDVEDCLPQEEYREQYPAGESESPYVFICRNPKPLIVKFPIKGRHKIYKLESHFHEAARHGLRT